jgi:diguanylate cyclase
MAELTEVLHFDASSNFDLGGVWAEFKDPSTETAFQASRYAEHRAALSRTLVFCSVFYLVFAVTDIGALGYSRETFVLFLARCAVALTCAIGLYHVRRRPGNTGALWVAATVVEVVGFVVFMLIAWNRPFEMPWHAMSMCIMLMVVSIFIPNRAHLAAAVAIVGTLAFIGMSYASGQLTPSALLTSSMLLVFTNSVGFVAARTHDRLARREFAQHALLTNVSIRDHLTGCFNRRYLSDVLFDAELRRAQRHKLTLAMILCDIDHFKAINDTYGHTAGDAVLRAFSSLLIAGTRQRIDSVIRYGGEEFLILLPHTHASGAAALAERMRASFEGTRVSTPDGRSVSATASFGVVAVDFTGGPSEVTEERLVDAADLQLYRAKQDGRNRVSVDLDSGIATV